MERYIKNVRKWFVENEELGKIYDTRQKFPTYLAHCESSSWELVLDVNKNTNGNPYFIPATKQEYNAQMGIVEQSKKGDKDLKQKLLKLLELDV